MLCNKAKQQKLCKELRFTIVESLYKQQKNIETINLLRNHKQMTS